MEHLKKHSHTHPGEKLYVCPHCDEGFSTPSELKKHVCIHTGEKPHVGLQRGKGNAMASVLQRHISTHTLHDTDARDVESLDTHTLTQSERAQ